MAKCRWNCYTLPENERIRPLKRDLFKEISSSNHPFSEDILVSGRVYGKNNYGYGKQRPNRILANSLRVNLGVFSQTQRVVGLERLKPLHGVVGP